MIQAERYVQEKFLDSKEKVPQNAFILGTWTNTQERELAPRGTSLLSYSQALDQIFFWNIFIVRRGIFVPLCQNSSKWEQEWNFVWSCIFFNIACQS